MGKKVLLYILGLILLIAFVYFSGIDLSPIFNVQNPALIILAFAFFILQFVVLAARMGFMLKTLGEKKPKILTLIEMEFFGKFVYYIAPFRLNIPAKALALNKVSGVKKGNALSMTSLEYALDSGFLLFLSIVGVFFFTQGLPYVSIDRGIIFLALFFSLGVIFFKTPLKLFEKLVEKTTGHSLPLRALNLGFRLVKKIRETWTRVLFHRNMYPILALLVLNWALRVICFELLFLSYGVYMPLGYIVTGMAAAIFLGGISQIPGGLGVREAAMVLLFSQLGATHGVTAGIALSVVLIDRLFSLAPIALGYFASLKIGISAFSKEILSRQK